MGLDWILENKCNNNEKDKYDFYRIKYEIKLLNNQLYDETDQENINKIEDKIEELRQKFDKVSISPDDSIQQITDEEIKIINNCTVGGGFDPKILDFRGNVIGRSDILNEELKMEAYINHNVEQCIGYAIKLELFAEKINKDKLNEDEQIDYDYLLKAIEWLKFWSSKGHGYYACY
jgi:hypothetical protein